ncbi:MAG TPA: hypothetical protein PK079_18380 [Leptospiraceae bacterium]|nr:hypothetical protein [Leptospiraceae bacterium]HMW05588.1 hypothetical protein [Leptospiraceae bacterium]HMX33547.1 hypothetical protein [Leptospiraceae bacterium]HMY31098.1 hypothetical protein [Leptospiraceae bacterium]HMZ66974.1 hypothetical protein [Leptospiraceae bacterium]
MKFFLIGLVLLLAGFSLTAQEKNTQKPNKLESEKEKGKEKQEKKETDNTKSEFDSKSANSVPFIGANVGSVWTVDEVKNTLIYSPDSMMKKSKYKRFIFDLKEFRKLGGNTKPEADFTIYYNVLQTDIENSKPENPNMQSPIDGFTFIINKCKIEKVEVNTP